MGNSDVELIAHLMRRAGFGATRDQLDSYAAQGYEATAEELLNPVDERRMGDDLIRRFHPELSGMMGPNASGENWLFRMATTTTPLQEKMSLFWHGIFATGYPKVIHGKALSDQIRMFRRHGMGSFRTLLVELSKDPAMIIWLDNQDNHKGAINENYGRELLELFSMGVGNYTEQDIKECARAFTGWTIGNREYMELRSSRDSDWPYGRISWHFEYRPEDHDDGEKTFLGETGNFDGEDIIDIICQQPATAGFICRHLYSFFVADEAQVPAWGVTPPRDEAAIDLMVDTFIESGYDIRSVLRVMFNSDFFKEARFARLKSPTEVVVGTLRMVGGSTQFPAPGIGDLSRQPNYMGQDLLNPPSVEGWHTGAEWINSGSLMRRVNFAAELVGDTNNPGVQSMVSRLHAQDARTPEQLVDGCLDLLGPLEVAPESRTELIEFAAEHGEFKWDTAEAQTTSSERIGELLQLIVSLREFQYA